MRVGVEDPVEHDLPEQAVEQLGRERLPRLRGQAGAAASSGRPSEVLHDAAPARRSTARTARAPGRRSSLAAVAATAVMFRASIRRSSSSRSASANPWARSTAPTERPQRVRRWSGRQAAGRCPGRRPPRLVDLRPAHLAHHLVAGRQRRGVHRDERRPRSSSGSKLANFRSPGRRARLRGPLTSGHGTLGASSAAGSARDGLRRQQVGLVDEHLAELDERDAAVFEGQPQRAGQPGPPPSAVASSDRRVPRRVGIRPRRASIRLICDVTARPAAQLPSAAQRVAAGQAASHSAPAPRR